MATDCDLVTVAEAGDRSILFAAEFCAPAANQESSKEEYWEVLRSLGRHLDSEGVSVCSQLPWPRLTTNAVSRTRRRFLLGARVPGSRAAQHSQLALERAGGDWLEPAGPTPALLGTVAGAGTRARAAKENTTSARLV